MDSKSILLSKEQKLILRFLFSELGYRKAIVLSIILFVTSILDLAGIALIYPFLRVVSEPEIAVKILTRLHLDPLFLSHVKFCFVFGASLILFYIFKMLLQSKMTQTQCRLLARFSSDMTIDLISKVLNARYALFQQTAASQIAGTTSITPHMSLAITALIQSLNDVLILSMMFLIVLFVQPLFALSSLFIMLMISFVVYFLIIRRITLLGKAQTKTEIVRYRLLFLIVSAIRDIKIMGLENIFDKRNSQNCEEYAELSWRNSFYSSLPRMIIEFFALIIIIGIALGVIYYETPLQTALPLLGFIVIATIRLIPSFSRLLGSVNAFKYSEQYIKELMVLREKLTDSTVVHNNDNLLFNHLIELKNINFEYGEKPVLKNINLQLKRGETIGIVGSSGAGKTTLLDVFTGLQQATSGQFTCDDTIFDPFTSRSIQKLIGYVPQTITLLDDTIAFNVSFEETPSIDLVNQALRMANLQTMVASLDEGVDTIVGENGLRLSGGQRQRLGIARALYRSPEILVFDEATSSLDTFSELELNEEIEKLHGKVSIVIVAHRLSSVINCDRIYVLANGCVEKHGPHSELLSTSPTYAKLYKSQISDL